MIINHLKIFTIPTGKFFFLQRTLRKILSILCTKNRFISFVKNMDGSRVQPSKDENFHVSTGTHNNKNDQENNIINNSHKNRRFSNFDAVSQQWSLTKSKRKTVVKSGLKLYLNGKLKLFSKASGRSENNSYISSLDLK